MIGKTLAILVAVLLIGIDDDKKDDKKKDEDKIQGVWAVESMERDGKQAPEEEGKDIKVTFGADGKVTFKMPDKEITGTYKLDAAKKPKTITLEATDEKTLYGIYKLEGDKLMICAAEGSADDRPTEFTTKEGSKSRLVVLKREKQ